MNFCNGKSISHKSTTKFLFSQRGDPYPDKGVRKTLEEVYGRKVSYMMRYVKSSQAVELLTFHHPLRLPWIERTTKSGERSKNRTDPRSWGLVGGHRSVGKMIVTVSYRFARSLHCNDLLTGPGTCGAGLFAASDTNPRLCRCALGYGSTSRASPLIV